jgi:hypothetical protein
MFAWTICESGGHCHPARQGLGVPRVVALLAGEKFQMCWEVDVIEQKNHEKPKMSNKTLEQNLTQILFECFVKSEKQNKFFKFYSFCTDVMLKKTGFFHT